MHHLRRRLNHYLHPLHVWCRMQSLCYNFCCAYERTLWRLLRRLLT